MTVMLFQGLRRAFQAVPAVRQDISDPGLLPRPDGPPAKATPSQEAPRLNHRKNLGVEGTG